MNTFILFRWTLWRHMKFNWNGFITLLKNNGSEYYITKLKVENSEEDVW